MSGVSEAWNIPEKHLGERDTPVGSVKGKEVFAPGMVHCFQCCQTGPLGALRSQLITLVHQRKRLSSTPHRQGKARRS